MQNWPAAGGTGQLQKEIALKTAGDDFRNLLLIRTV